MVLFILILTFIRKKEYSDKRRMFCNGGSLMSSILNEFYIRNRHLIEVYLPSLFTF